MNMGPSQWGAFPSMAGNRTIFSFSIPKPEPAASHRFRLRPLLASTTSTPSFPPRRLSTRKNHLRPKILKTLNKPFSSAPLPLLEPLPLSTPPPNDQEFVHEEVAEFLLSEAVGRARDYGGNVGKFSVNSVLKFWCYLLGVFLFQAICTVLVLGVSNSFREEGYSGTKGRALANGEAVYIDREEMERRIKEIREMAREARERERMERDEEGSEESEIGKEVGARLDKLEKRLDKRRKERLPPGNSVLEYLGLDGNVEDEEEEEEEEVAEGGGIERFMFEKKVKFRGSLSGSRSESKGFSGFGGSSSGVKDNNPTAEFLDGGKDEGHSQNGLDSGSLQETYDGASPAEATKSCEPSGPGRQISQSVMKECQLTAKKSTPDNGHTARYPLKRTLVNEAIDKQSNGLTDIWWLKLPYVLGILMRRGSELDVEGGLFTLRLTSSADVVEDTAYTLAFEDHSDANNFCLLLESYFEDLGDIMPDIVPLSTKELYELVKSQSRRVLVVKKRQLKLYAGQPFAEVERSLCSLLEHKL